jgi:hypothetical protein
MSKTKKIEVLHRDVSIKMVNREDYICITDIAKYKNSDDPRFVIQNWMKTRSTVEFLGIWEIINNADFNRVEFDTVKNESGSNAFVLTPAKWVKLTNAIGIFSKSGRYGGTYAHKDIAFEFASWISAEFKLYLIKEFQRLKEDEQKQLGWDIKRNLFINEGLEQKERLKKLNTIAIQQMKLLIADHGIKKLEDRK